VVAFNVDPLFNNAVDGLMYIRIADIPESTKPVMEEFQAELERKASGKRRLTYLHINKSLDNKHLFDFMIKSTVK
jgi:hypothetical protein